jgi:hypothetical protein
MLYHTALAREEAVSFHGDRTRIAKPPSRLLAIPWALLAMAMALPVFVQWRAEEGYRHIPATRFFDGLPVAGSWRDAQKAGFSYCIDFKVTMRCRRTGLTLMGHGPYSAAVDLAGGDGRGGFNQLTLWSDRDQDAPIDLADDLERRGWESCRTKRNGWGDQYIFMRQGSPLRISIDISYYGKRRIRIIPEWNEAKPVCETGRLTG